MNMVEVTDERQQSKVKWPLLPTLFAIIIAWCCGCNSAVAVADYLRRRHDFFSKVIVGFPRDGNISHDTVLRLLKTVKFSELEEFLKQFCSQVEHYAKISNSSDKRILSLDGQTPRALEYQPVEGAKCPQDRRIYNKLYFVTLYDSTNELALAQDEVADKENENKCCLRLLDLFSLEGSIITADALNTQRAIAEKIIEKGGEYCLALKGNHAKLCEAVERAFALEDDTMQPLLNPDILHDAEAELKTYTAPVENGHGRVEERQISVLPAAIIKNRVLGEWKKDCECLVKAVTVTYDKKYKVQKEPLVRYYLCSINPEDESIAETAYRAVRHHWHIETMHWLLDVDFGQDRMQVKSREYARNRILLDKLATNVLRTLQPKFSKKSEKFSLSRLKDELRDVPSLAVEGLAAYCRTDKTES